MRIRNLHKLIHRGVAVLSFGTGVLLSLALSGLESPPNDNSRAVSILTSAREWRPMLYLDEEPFNSDDFLIVQRSAMLPSLTHPVSEPLPENDLLEHNCGTLTVSLDREGNLKLNADNFGTLNDTIELTSNLKEIFQRRVEQRAYLGGMENRTDLPVSERIPRTVLIRASRSLSYGDVIKIVEVLKEVKANPIGLQINSLPE